MMISFLAILFFGSIFLMIVNRSLTIHIRKQRPQQLESQQREAEYMRDIQKIKDTEQSLRDQVDQSDK